MQELKLIEAKLERLLKHPAARRERGKQSTVFPRNWNPHPSKHESEPEVAPVKASQWPLSSQRRPSFVDLCAGCGGLSLGLGQAGWKGIFAAERDAYAFETLKHNLIEQRVEHFDWPDWLPKAAHSLEAVISGHEPNLRSLRGKVDLMAGGPPCQGFSMNGRRNAHDPRNQVFRQYIKLVELTQPTMVLMENVRGIVHPFDVTDAEVSEGEKSLSYAEIICAELQRLGYKTWRQIVHARDFGVPQNRPRFILIGLLEAEARRLPTLDPFKILCDFRVEFLRGKGLPDRPVTIREAISDLTRSKDRLFVCPESPKFTQGSYGKQTSPFQELLHGEMNGDLADSHRFAKHLDTTIEKFTWFLENCPKGRRITEKERGRYANKKHSIHILNGNSVGPTMTTLPDDFLHYSEPRILTVREMARLQSFPDWYRFKGKYTTGGECRAKECPRYTQVGNAVPPLLAEALGLALIEILAAVEKK